MTPTESLVKEAREAAAKIHRFSMNSSGLWKHFRERMVVKALLLRLASALEATTTSAPQGGELVVKYVPDLVRNAMLTVWNEICSDTGHHPLDIEHDRGKVLKFSPGHWARMAGEIVAAQIARLFDATTPTPPAPVGDVRLTDAGKLRGLAEHFGEQMAYFTHEGMSHRLVLGPFLAHVAGALSNPEPSPDVLALVEEAQEAAKAASEGSRHYYFGPKDHRGDRELFSVSDFIGRLADALRTAAPSPAPPDVVGLTGIGHSQITISVNGRPLIVDTTQLISLGLPFCGGGVKARIPGFDPSCALLLLRDDGPDLLVSDEMRLPIVDGLRFITVPPALGA